MASAVDLLDSLLQNGMKKSTTGRLEHSLGEQGLGGQGGFLDEILGSLTGAGKAPAPRGAEASRTPAGGASGGLGELFGSLLGGASGLKTGALGAIAGAILGGGSKSMKGAAGGGALAILGSLALKALRGSGSESKDSLKLDSSTRLAAGLRLPENPQEEVQLLSVAALMIKAMVNAAKADGRVDEKEIQRIVGNAKKDGFATEADELLDAELRKPLDTDGIVRAVTSPQVAAQVYAASLMAIDLDTADEKNYLAELARKLRLDDSVVRKLHSAVGVA
ncbi:MAG: tellurite resistance TerB family protein [Planctomycetales bacterium]